MGDDRLDLAAHGNLLAGFDGFIQIDRLGQLNQEGQVAGRRHDALDAVSIELVFVKDDLHPPGIIGCIKSVSVHFVHDFLKNVPFAFCARVSGKGFGRLTGQSGANQVTELIANESPG